MKRVIIILTICLFVMSLTVLSTVASSEKLTLEEAKNIIWESFLFTNKVRNSPKLNYDNVYIREGAQLGERPYYEVIEFPGGSYNGMKEYAETIFSKEIAKYSYTYSQYKNSLNDNNIYPLFVISENGTIYGGHDRIIQYASVFLSLDSKEPGYVFPFVTKSTDEYNADKLLVEMVKSTDINATAKICFRIGSETESYIYWADCNFIKEDGVWKVSGGEYFDLFNGTYRENSPSTSDPAFNLIFILPTVSVAALASAFCLMRRRRDLI